MNLENRIGLPESTELEYEAVLPPARSLAQKIAAMANANGGVIVLGIHELNGEVKITGLSSDFQANSVMHKAIDLLQPKPEVEYDYVIHGGKRLYAIEITRSELPIAIDNKIYVRKGRRIDIANPTPVQVQSDQLPIITTLFSKLAGFQPSSTGAKSKFLEHYMGILNIVQDSKSLLYPVSESIPTTNLQGKILMRILFSSCADNFETYLTDLMYEIYLANPATLKSKQQVTVEEVLDCADRQEFVMYWAKKKLSKLQRGSVKGFIADNPQIKDLNVLTEAQQDSIDKIIQIRHLYAHRNGIVDEKFLQFYPNQFRLNEAHQLSLNDMLAHFAFLAETVDKLDKEAILKYQLTTL